MLWPINVRLSGLTIDRASLTNPAHALPTVSTLSAAIMYVGLLLHIDQSTQMKTVFGPEGNALMNVAGHSAVQLLVHPGAKILCMVLECYVFVKISIYSHGFVACWDYYVCTIPIIIFNSSRRLDRVRVCYYKRDWWAGATNRDTEDIEWFKKKLI